MGGTSEENDQFGFSLAASHFNSDGKNGLVAGVPFEEIGNINSTRAVHVISGSSSGLSTIKYQIIHQIDGWHSGSRSYRRAR